MNRDEILQYGDTTILEALRRLPGVSIGGSGRGGDIRMRGLGRNYTQILVNGERMPPGFSLEELSPDLIERIEIYRSATAEFSARAVAGTINVVLRRAVTTRKREVKLSLNEHRGYPSGSMSVQFADRADRLSYMLPLSVNAFRFGTKTDFEQVELDAGGHVAERHLTRARNRGEGMNAGFSPRLQWALARDHQLTLEMFANVNRFRGANGEDSTTLAGAGPDHDVVSSRVDSRSGSARANATWTRRFEGARRMEARLGLSHHWRDSGITTEFFDGAGARTLLRLADNGAADTSLTTTGKYSAPIIPGHAFVFGWDGAHGVRTEDREQRDDAPPGFPQFDLAEEFEARVSRLALFAQDEWNLTPRLSAYLGLRWEGIRTASEGNVLQEVTSDSGVWSPIAQVLWKLPGTEKDQVRAAIARTYKSPNTFDLMPRRFFSNNNTPTTPDLQGNPDLRPELSWGLDVGYERYFTGGGLFSLSAYYRRVDDLMARELLEVAGTFIERPVNRGEAIVRGIEMDTRFGLRKLLPDGPPVDLRANLGWNDSDVRALPGPFNYLADQTRVTANLGFDHKLAGAPLSIGGNFGYRSGGPIRTSERQLARRAWFRTLDLYALWRFSPQANLRFTAGNLLAQDVETASEYFDATRTILRASRSESFRRLGAVLEVKL